MKFPKNIMDQNDRRKKKYGICATMSKIKIKKKEK
jgi:hypothetical protein